MVALQPALDLPPGLHLMAAHPPGLRRMAALQPMDLPPGLRLMVMTALQPALYLQPTLDLPLGMMAVLQPVLDLPPGLRRCLCRQRPSGSWQL